MFKSSPTVTLVKTAGSMPATPLFYNRIRQFGTRLAEMPDGKEGGEIIVGNSQLAMRL